MPTITHKKGDNPHFRMFRLMAHMLWPLVEDRRRLNSYAPALLNAEVAVFNRQFPGPDSQFALQSPYLPSEVILDTCFQEAWFPELVPDKARQAVGGYISVAVMTYFLIGLHTAKQVGRVSEVSLGKAAALTGYNGVKRHNRTALVLKSGKQIMAEWKKLSRVVHFWTAYLTMMPMAKRGDPVFHDLDQFSRRSSYLASKLGEFLEKPIDFWLLKSRKEAMPFTIELADSTLELLQWYKADPTGGPRIEFPKTRN